MSGYRRFNELLDKLEIRNGDLIYLHTSFSRMSYLELTGEQFLNSLLERLGPKGTLVLPSFAWHLDKSQRPWIGYRTYFETRPVFDVKNTPANIGYIPELFRQMPNVERSCSYWWSVCAKGAMAQDLTRNQEKISHYYGEHSSFDLLRIQGVKILGLGVTLNTTSLALIPDHVLADQHTQQVFTDSPQKGLVINRAGEEIMTFAYWLLPEVVRLIKPSVLFEESPALQNVMRRHDNGTTIQFAYPYAVYHGEAIRLGRQACLKGLPVPWLRNYPLRNLEV